MLLMVAAEKEKNLGLEPEALAVFIESFEERIFFKDFEQELGVEYGLTLSGECGLAYSNHAFDGDVHVFLQWSPKPWTRILIAGAAAWAY